MHYETARKMIMINSEREYGQNRTGYQGRNKYKGSNHGKGSLVRECRYYFDEKDKARSKIFRLNAPTPDFNIEKDNLELEKLKTLTQNKIQELEETSKLCKTSNEEIDKQKLEITQKDEIIKHFSLDFDSTTEEIIKLEKRLGMKGKGEIRERKL